MNKIITITLIAVVGLLQMNSVQARSDDHIKAEIAAKFSESEVLQNTQINIYVEKRLVVLTGSVRLLVQKLLSDRLAWTTLGVFEVDNELRVSPKIALSDKAIEVKIRDIIKSYRRFDNTDMAIVVKQGVVSIESGFTGIADPVFLKHKLAAIEGVIDVKVHATFKA